MAPPSAFTQFLGVLTAGARFMVRYEPVVIGGSHGETLVPGLTESRVVLRVTPGAVYFSKPTGEESVFVFPNPTEIVREGESFVWTGSRGVRLLSYTPVSA